MGRIDDYGLIQLKPEGISIVFFHFGRKKFL